MLTAVRTRNRLVNVETIAGPATEPVSRDDAKAFLKVTDAPDDALIDSMIKAARTYVENKTHRALITQTVRTTWEATALPLRVLRPPVISISKVVTVYQGVTSEEANPTTRFFIMQGLRPTIHPISTASLTEASIHQVRLETVNGYGAASAVPPDLVEAVKTVLKVMYDYRDGFSDQSVNEVPISIDHLIGPYIVPVL